MKISGERLIPASKQSTWLALNDPAILKQCIRGCETFERVSDHEYAIKMTAKIGPVSASFQARVTLSGIDAPNSYTLEFSGQGGAAGFARGNAVVKLSATTPNETLLSYTASASIGGKLAQIGSRLVDAAANKVSSDFFTAFNVTMTRAAEHSGNVSSGVVQAHGISGTFDAKKSGYADAIGEISSKSLLLF